MLGNSVGVRAGSGRTRMDEDGTRMDEDGTRMDEDGTRMDEDGTRMDEDGHLGGWRADVRPDGARAGNSMSLSVLE